MGTSKRKSSKADDELARQLQVLYVAWDGDDEAIEEIVRLVWPRIHRRVKGGGGDEDIEQEVFMRLLEVKHEGTLRDPARLLPFLLNTAKHKLTREWRHSSRSVMVELDEDRTPASTPDEGMRSLHLAQLLEGVQEEYMEVLIEYEVEEYTAAEIAIMHGVTEGAVRSRIRRVKEQIRRRHGIGVRKEGG
ncbi:RNA polymerase sigma factor [Paraliomyxa miuraensis]|uniref:RNA polymerase sigma factor n=1 Tax=Paraliomyxa miuraensis TaxID=376150 RepID=UPI002255D343|nr:sigma-70 family RNA polymerase sigma factor [Paraliomyxa miuraensis]MCX4240339.1 sigma-70 family RNA polymerase sigma factor [Paraliomyxa miuraensis]